jgi:hypothetical protein
LSIIYQALSIAICYRIVFHILTSEINGGYNENLFTTYKYYCRAMSETGTRGDPSPDYYSHKSVLVYDYQRPTNDNYCSDAYEELHMCRFACTGRASDYANGDGRGAFPCISQSCQRGQERGGK